MALTQHIGYGCFQLEDFLPGEMFARYDGSLACVCEPQPPLGDHTQVWVDYGTSNARKELLHRTALAYAVSEEQAWSIVRRRKEVADGSACDPA